MLSKYKDCIYIILIVTVGPEILDMFIYSLKWHHRAGFFLLGLAAIWEILRRGIEDADKVQQVFAAKNVQVEGKYPRLVVSKKGDENARESV